MPSANPELLIRRWRERFRNDPLAAGVIAGLGGRGAEIWRETFDLLKRESPEYRNSVDDEFTHESKNHCNELLQTIVALGSGRHRKWDAQPFDFVRRHAQWRARRDVPLIASLHAYRLAHKTYQRISRESLLQHPDSKAVICSLTTMSDFWLEVFDHVGAVLAETHAAEESLTVAQGSRTYVGLIESLLLGRPPTDLEARRLRVVCGGRPDTSIAVAVIRPLQVQDDTQTELEVKLRSHVRLVEQMLPAASFGRLIGIRDGEVVAIAFSNEDAARALLKTFRRSGFTQQPPRGSIAGVGISRNITAVADLPGALEEARLALEFAGAARRVVSFGEIDLSEFLIRRSDSAALRLIPAWAHRFASGKDVQSRDLSRTIRAFAECSFNVKRTALHLSVHANTVYFRLNRINQLTGVDPRTYFGVSLLLTALRMVEIHHRAS